MAATLPVCAGAISRSPARSLVPAPARTTASNKKLGSVALLA
jgi:hypothetical protein